jgi:hypothetical protein
MTRESTARGRSDKDRRRTGTAPRPRQRRHDRGQPAGLFLDTLWDRPARQQFLGRQALGCDQFLAGGRRALGDRRLRQAPSAGDRGHHGAGQPPASRDHTEGRPAVVLLKLAFGGDPQRGKLCHRHPKVAPGDVLQVSRRELHPSRVAQTIDKNAAPKGCPAGKETALCGREPEPPRGRYSLP